MLNRFTAAAAGLFTLGLALVALSILRGEASAGIFVCVPFFLGTGLFASLGVLCFFGGMLALLVGMTRSAGGAGLAEEPEPPAGKGAAPVGPEAPGPDGAPRAAPKIRAGGVILIGPIPIVFGSDPGISRAMFYVAIGLMATFLVVLLALAFL